MFAATVLYPAAVSRFRKINELSGTVSMDWLVQNEHLIIMQTVVIIVFNCKRKNLPFSVIEANAAFYTAHIYAGWIYIQIDRARAPRTKEHARHRAKIETSFYTPNYDVFATQSLSASRVCYRGAYFFWLWPHKSYRAFKWLGIILTNASVSII